MLRLHVGSKMRLLLSVLFVGWMNVCVLWAQAPAVESLDSLKESIKKAGALLKEGKVVECAETVEVATKAIEQVAIEVDSKEISELKKAHAQLVRAHELLEIEGAELSELPSWDALLKARKNKTKGEDGGKPKTKPPASEAVSFTRDLAPWMVEQCGRCHINNDRGGFSMATYAALIKGSKGGVVLFPGDPVGSRLVESIETGDMPRGGGKVSTENLNKLKLWITQGAKFDGPDAAAPIASLVGNKSPTPPPSNEPAKKDNAPQVTAPTGKETVSFARDIAPILMANCNGCHYGGMRNSGGLQFNNFAQLLKGGDSGPAVLANKPDMSLIIRKLKGMEGARMPLGRPPLSDDKIEMVATWIKEGAAFDGHNKDAGLEAVVGQSFATKASHDELKAKRDARARERWKVVSPKSEADEASNDQFLVIGNIGPESSKALLAQANNAASQVRKMFKIPAKTPLVKGGITIFALKQRYDYSEFGKMAEGRSLPTEWSSHWKADVLDMYVAIVFDKSERINESSLVQQITSLWLSSHEGVPKWFSDGAGRYALMMNSGQNDARVVPWIKRLPESMAQLKDLKPFLEGTMNDEDSATIGFGIIRFMHDSQMKRQYDAIIRAIVGGTAFDQAFKKSVGPMDIFLQQVLGKAK